MVWTSVALSLAVVNCESRLASCFAKMLAAVGCLSAMVAVGSDGRMSLRDALCRDAILHLGDGYFG
jgi:hypothetical protein